MVFCDFILFFFIYSFLGWLLETIYESFHEGSFINRGFLFGFICPIYGFGAVMIILLYIKVKTAFIHPSVIFTITIIFSILVTTVLEFITGYIMDKIFNSKWWNYSDEIANIQGYICLKYSFIWGGLAFLLIIGVHSLVLKSVACIPASIKKIMEVGIILFFIADTIMSTINALNLSNIIANNFQRKLLAIKKCCMHFQIWFF
jgi:uncharacterized membrane protein